MSPNGWANLTINQQRCEHCGQLVASADYISIVRNAPIYTGCYACLWGLCHAGASHPALLRRALVALTTPIALDEHERLCNDIQAALS